MAKIAAMSRRIRPVAVQAFVAVCIALVASPFCQAADDSAHLAQFENEIRPLLVTKCLECHGPRKAESGLRLDQLETALAGGDSGPALVPGKPAESLLLAAVRHVDGLEMPPAGKLDATEVASLERWIDQGAAWPTGVRLGGVGPALRSGPITDEERNFWSFRLVSAPLPPRVESPTPINNEIDRFVVAKLTAAGLTMRAPAEKRVLLRRATFDLTGLPPTPEETDAFLADEAPDAFARVIERLLASPAYGERWGRHWLDVVRYADTAGETADYPTPLAYKYRNWVIDALNEDLPYDEFVRQQIAGDLLAADLEAAAEPSDARAEHIRRAITATGFIAISRRFGFDSENYHHLTIQDTIDTVGQAVLGLSLGCARCHDHKYDPVTAADYYAWYGIFKSTRYSFPGSEEKKRPYDLLPILAPKAAAARGAEYDARVAALEQDIAALVEPTKDTNDQSPEMKERRARHEQLIAERDAVRKTGAFDSDQLVYGAAEAEAACDVPVQLRGEPLKPGSLAPRRNLEILGGQPLALSTGSGRRELAAWLTAPTNPLTARVMVNRIWQHHFGRGLVGSENDFGARGERPSHPELLDWLASRFVERGWSVKSLHRLIMSSATYQQRSADDTAAAQTDPEARLLWRFNIRRLSAEELRDAMLLSADQLDRSPGGAHPFPAVDSWGFTQHAPFYGQYPTNQRSVYLMQQRLKRHPFLALFDGADPNATTARRGNTTVPTQALYLMNSEFVHDQSRALAERIVRAAADEPGRLSFAWRTTLGREPSEQEAAEAAAFLQKLRMAASTENTPGGDIAAWAALGRTLLTRNEFLFVD